MTDTFLWSDDPPDSYGAHKPTPRHEPTRVLTSRTFGRLRHLIEAPPLEAAARGAELLSWLHTQPKPVVEAALNELVGWMENSPYTATLIAALEVLVRAAPQRAGIPVARALSARPVIDLHVYPLAFARMDGVSNDEVVRALLTLLSAIMEPIVDEDDVGELAVEAFITLATLAPSSLLEQAAPALRGVTGLEQVRLLNAVADAVRRSPNVVPGPFAAAVNVRWETLLASKADDFPVLAAPLLEIKGRCNLSFGIAISRMKGAPTESRVLYQLLQRPLDFLDEDDRMAIISRTTELLVKQGEFRTLAKVFGMVTQDPSFVRRVARVIARGL